jgi:hypothetical protein
MIDPVNVLNRELFSARLETKLRELDRDLMKALFSAKPEANPREAPSDLKKGTILAKLEERETEPLRLFA